MAKQMTDEGELDDRLAEAQTQIESLQAVAADAEARAATARQELEAERESRSVAEAAQDAAEGELVGLRAEMEETRTRLGEAAVKYREAKLASAPEIPPDLVPPAQSLSEIDEGFEAARRVVGQLRERMQEELRPARVPVGAPARRAPDLSALPAAEKIKLGLRELSEREGRRGG